MNLPNSITLTRLIMIPLIIFFYLANFIPFGKLVAGILFIVACLTDFLDGYVARKYNKVTTLGKFFDSIADKVLVMTGLVLIVSAPIIGATPLVYPAWLGIVCAIIILAREFIVSALRQLAAAKGIVLAADMGGKVKATAQYIVITLYMIMAFVKTDLIDQTAKEPLSISIINFAFMILLIATTFLTIYSGASYIIRNIKVFNDKDEKIKKDEIEIENFSAQNETLENEFNNDETEKGEDVLTEQEQINKNKKNKK